MSFAIKRPPLLALRLLACCWCALLAAETPVVAEAWPTVQKLGAMSSLIVRVEAAKGRDGGSLFAVREVWKGAYAPPPDGHIRVNDGVGSLAGECLLFCAAHNHSSSRMLGSYDMGLPLKDSTPEAVDKPRYEADGKTCVFKVKLEPGRTYGYWLSSQKFTNFKDQQGRSSVPYLLVFSTKDK